ncbi:MAG: Heme A synthase, cytochrome oxidase biogenesis protein Cox15-CtaA, partial [uncultured Actinomycetospora sp.]
AGAPPRHAAPPHAGPRDGRRRRSGRHRGHRCRRARDRVGPRLPDVAAVLPRQPRPRPAPRDRRAAPVGGVRQPAARHRAGDRHRGVPARGAERPPAPAPPRAAGRGGAARRGRAGRDRRDHRARRAGLVHGRTALPRDHPAHLARRPARARVLPHRDGRPAGHPLAPRRPRRAARAARRVRGGPRRPAPRRHPRHRRGPARRRRRDPAPGRDPAADAGDRPRAPALRVPRAARGRRLHGPRG